MNNYFSFEIWIDPPLRKPKKGEPAIFPVRVTISPRGPALGIMQLNLKDKSFQANLVTVQSAGVELKTRKDFGILLYQALFTGDVGEAWVGSLGSLESSKVDGMRLRLWINDRDLSILPWELLFCEKYGGFLATTANLAISRYLPVLEPPEMPIPGAIEVLVAVASPIGPPAIREEDVQGLETVLQKLSPKVHYRVERDISIGKIQHALAQGIHVLHFLGHGQPGKLALVKETDKKVDPIPDEAFAQLFSGRPHLRLVVLSACASGQKPGENLFSGVGPMVIQKRIPAVIAMQYPTIQMDSAARFSEALYQNLSYGLPVDIAVNSARQLLSAGPLLETRDWSTPVLYMGTRNGSILNLSSPESTTNFTLWARVKATLQDPILSAHFEDHFQKISVLQTELSEYMGIEDTLSALKISFSGCIRIVEKTKGNPAGLNTLQLRTAWQAVKGQKLLDLESFIMSHPELTAVANVQSIATEVGKIDQFLKQLSLYQLFDQIINFDNILARLVETVHQEQRNKILRLIALTDDALSS